MRKSLIILLPIGLWMAWAQTPKTPSGGPQQAPKKEAFKNLAPVARDVLKVTLPKAQEFVLDNGMTVLILEDYSLPQISISMDIKGGGGLFDPAEMRGLSSAAATLMREGTASKSSKE